MSPPNYHFSGLPTPIIATRFDSSGTPYPPISPTTIRTLKWGNARHLMLPFLSEYDKANVHKKTRTNLSKLLEARIVAGDVTVKQFWDVVGLEKVQQKEKKKAPMDPFVAAALFKNKMSAAPAVAEALLKNPSSMAVRSPAAAYLPSPAKKPSLNQHHSLVWFEWLKVLSIPYSRLSNERNIIMIRPMICLDSAFYIQMKQISKIVWNKTG